jgi:hypothetical protein
MVNKNWIWCAPVAADRNVYAFFRRGFSLDRPESVRVRITADSFYTLFVDGRFVARGPARGPLSAYSFDTHALELGAGAHALAVLVHHVGEVNATIMTGRPGLLVEASAGGHDLSSGAAWRCRKSDAWRRDFPEKMSHFGFPEECDLRAIPAGWTGVAFNDEDWSPATVVARVGDAPWTALLERDIPLLRHADVPARGVAAHGHYTPGAAGGMPSKEVAGGRFERVADAAALPFRFAAGAGAFLTLDFGRTVSGYPRLAFAGATAGTVVELSYDELLTADGAVDPERTYARLTDRFILAGGAGTVATAHPRGFRYLMLTVREPAGLELRAAVVDEETYPFAVRNRFACADPLLETLHATGVETVRVCTQDAFMDCPSRERVQWTADLLMHGRVAATACADTVMLRHTLLQAAQSQLPDGRINGFFPSERTNCAFAASSLSWLHALIDYWEFTGDGADLAALAPAAQRLLAMLAGVSDEHGVIRRWPAGQFWEWAPIESGSDACLLLTNASACWAQARMLAVPALAALLPADAAPALDRRRGILHDLFWVPERGLYRDALPDRPLRFAQSPNALAVLAGICPAAERRAVLGRILDPAALGPLPRGESTPDKDPPPDPAAIIPCGTLLMASFVCEALFAVGMDAEALAALRRYWGPFADAPTFPEVRVQGDNSGLCHGWSAGPSYLLPRYVLGVHPLSGWNKLRFDPRPGDLGQADGTFLTPGGEASVRWTHSAAGGLDASFVLPAGVEMDIAATGERLVGPVACNLRLTPKKTGPSGNGGGSLTDDYA